jgi:hypothetical protein
VEAVKANLKVTNHLLYAMRRPGRKPVMASLVEGGVP